MGCPPVILDGFCAMQAFWYGKLMEQSKLLTWEPARKMLEFDASDCLAACRREQAKQATLPVGVIV